MTTLHSAWFIIIMIITINSAVIMTKIIARVNPVHLMNAD